MAAKAAVHGAPQKAFSRNASDENERWRWTEDVYQRKNNDVEKNNNYDWNRRELNFEINQGKIEKLGSNELRLHERLQRKLDGLDFKTYKDDAQNKPNCSVDWVFSGDHDRMCEMAFGKEYRNIDFSLKNDNTEAIEKTDAYKYHSQKGKKKAKQLEIHKWAIEVYKFVCRKWGEENVIGMEVHLDETTPHAHVLMVPVAERKSRGRLSTKYEKKDDPSVTILKKDYEQLSETEKIDYQPVSKKSKRLVSYSGVFGDNYPERKEYMKQFHTDFYEQVGKHFGLERGDDLDLLDPEERRKRRHMRKDQLHAVLEHERNAEEVAQKNAELIQKQKELDDAINSKNEVLQELSERIRMLPSEEELVRRKELNEQLPTLKQLADRKKKFQSSKRLLANHLAEVSKQLEAVSDYKTLGELNKLGTINDDVEWFKAASMFLSSRNQNMLKEAEKLQQKIEKGNETILLLTENVNDLKREEARLSMIKKNVYKSAILPIVDEDVEVCIEKSREGNMCVFARIGGEWIGKKLSENSLYDYSKGIATKEQIAAIYLTGDILKFVNDRRSEELEKMKNDLEAKKSELANIHVPTRAEIERARQRILNARKEEYEKLSLPIIRGNIDTEISDVEGDADNIYVFAKVDEGKWHKHPLTIGQYDDFVYGIATKEQLAALLLSDEIIRDATQQSYDRLKNFEEKSWSAELAKRTISLFGEMGTSIKKTVSDLDSWTRRMCPNPTQEQIDRLHLVLTFLVDSKQAKDKREAAGILCSNAMPESGRYNRSWRSHVVDIVNAVAEQGPLVNLRRSRGRGRGW